MKIGHFDAICAMGGNIEEIFENLLNKIIYMNGDYTNGDEMLYTGRMVDEDFSAKISKMVVGYTRKNEAHLLTINTQKVDGFASSQEASNFQDAIALARQMTDEGKRVLLLASHRTDDDEIAKYINEGKYSQGVAKPFDIDADGLNLADTAVIIEFCNDGTYELENFDEKNSEQIEYVHTCANGIRDEDEKLSEMLAKLFTQTALIGSPIGVTGQCGNATDALSLSILCQAIREEIVPASSMLEHGFTNTLNFAYANKMKKLKNILFVDMAGNYYKLSNN